MNSTHFGAIHYDIHLDMKLDYTISRIFQEMSLSELETLHQLCELERIQILQSLALAVLKYHMQDMYYPEIDQTSSIMKETFYGITLVPKNITFLYFSQEKRKKNETKIRSILLFHFQEEFLFGIQQSHVDQKIATMLYN